jgi:hypothetical protein
LSTGTHFAAAQKLLFVTVSVVSGILESWARVI